MNPKEGNPRPPEERRLRRWMRRVGKFFKDAPPPPLTAAEVIGAGGMTTRETFYSQTPGLLRDIDGERLLHMYNKINQRVGEQAAIGFSQMIFDLPSLAGIHVIRSITNLAEHAWIYIPEEHPEAGDTHPIQLADTKDDTLEQVMGVATFSSFAAYREDQTEDIKEDFRRVLEQAGIVIPPSHPEETA